MTVVALEKALAGSKSRIQLKAAGVQELQCGH